MQASAPYELRAVAYAVWGAGSAYDRDPHKQYERWNPTEPRDFLFSGANPLFPAQTREQFMDRAARQQDAELDEVSVSARRSRVLADRPSA